mgnify:CR=1 FL=1
MPKRYWLLKTEPDAYSIDDLQRDKTTCWDGVRNYQARNFMRDQMQVGDDVFIYHSNAQPTGIAGLAKVSKAGYADSTALDPKDVHFDPKATKDNPIWMRVDVAFEKKLGRVVTLEEIKAEKKLATMLLVQRGQRLSVQPVEAGHFAMILKMAGQG